VKKYKQTMEKHHQLKTDIQLLTEEWEKLTLEAEANKWGIGGSTGERVISLPFSA